MADKEHVTTVYGKHHKYEVIKRPGGTFTSSTYFISRDDGKTYGSYSSMAAAVKAAHEKAGPGAYES
jgi:hypothetical protein